MRFRSLTIRCALAVTVWLSASAARADGPADGGAIDPALSKALIDSLRTPDENVRRQVARGLLAMGKPVCGVLAEALADRDPNVRAVAAELLGRLKHKPAEPKLAGALKDTDARVRRQAAAALDALQWRPADDRRKIEYLLAKGRADLVVAMGGGHVEPVIATLADPSAATRIHAIEALAALEDRRTLSVLIGALGKDKAVGVRRAAAVALGGRGDGPAAAALTAALRDSAAEVRLAAAKALARIARARSAAAGALLAALAHEDLDVRAVAAEAMGRLGDRRAVGPLMSNLKHAHPPLRAAAAAALAKLGDPRAVEALTATALTDTHYAPRRAGVAALAVFGKAAMATVAAAMKDEDPRVQEAAVEAAVKIGPHAGGALLESLKGNDRRQQAAAAEALGRLKYKPAMPALIALLRTPHTSVRMSAVEALDALGDNRAAGPLAKVVEDRNVRLADAAAETLTHMGTPGAEALMSFLCADKYDVGRRARRALYTMRGDAVPLLRKALAAENAPRRAAAARLLSRIGWQPTSKADRARLLIALGEFDQVVAVGPAACGPLVTALRRKGPRRRDAAMALGALRDNRAIGPLSEAMGDSEAGVRAAAVSALAKFGPSQVRRILVALHDEGPGVQRAARTAVRQMGKKAAGALIAVLWDKDPRVRQGAVRMLGEMGGKRAVFLLAESLKDKEGSVRISAAAALADLGDERGLTVLTAALQDWRMAPAAAGALARLDWRPAGEAEAIHLLVARRRKSDLLAKWPVAKKVLLADIRGGGDRAIENALYALVGLGRKEVVSDLHRLLTEHGREAVAVGYLKYGPDEVRDAAEKWIRRHGRPVSPQRRRPHREWGGM